MTKEIQTIEINCKDLISLEATLEKVVQAARAGDLDWEGCQIRATLKFSTWLPSMTFGPLEALIDSQNAPWGVDVLFCDRNA